MAPAAGVQLGCPFWAHDELGVLLTEWAQGHGRHAGEGRSLLRPTTAHDDDMAVGQPTWCLSEPGGRCRVGEMDVVDDQHQGPALRLAAHDTEERGEQQCLSSSGLGQDAQLGGCGRLGLAAEERAQGGDVRTEDIGGPLGPGSADHHFHSLQQWLNG